MRVLLTGGSGFVGQWLTRALLERGDEVFIAGPDLGAPTPAILTEEDWRHVRRQTTDVRDGPAVDRAVTASAPDWVVHLAGVSFPPDADRDPSLTYDINTLGAVRLLGSLARAPASGPMDPVRLVVGTGLQYGWHDAAEMPLAETAELRPLTIYAATKAAQEV